MESFVATVTKVYTEFDKPVDENDFVATNNEDYIGKNDNRFLGAIEFYKESFINKQRSYFSVFKFSPTICPPVGKSGPLIISKSSSVVMRTALLGRCNERISTMRSAN